MPTLSRRNLRRRVTLLGCAAFAVFAQARQGTDHVPGFPPYAPAPTMLEVVKDQGDTVLVRHKLGETSVPKNPQRIFADSSTLEPLLMLGLTPVGATSPYADSAEPSAALAPLLAPVKLTPRGDINLEAALALDPDLIVVAETTAYFDTTYKQLSAIAPTIVLDGDPYSYQQKAVTDLAAVFGLEAQAAEKLSSYNQAVAAQCRRIGRVLGEKTLAVIDIYADSAYLIAPGYGEADSYSPGSIAKYYADCSIEPSPDLRELVGLMGSAQLSLELLPSVQADYLIVNNFSEASYESWQERDIWRLLPAVKAGRVYALLPAIWGLYGDLATLERFADLLTDAAP